MTAALWAVAQGQEHGAQSVPPHQRCPHFLAEWPQTTRSRSTQQSSGTQALAAWTSHTCEQGPLMGPALSPRGGASCSRAEGMRP